jgi:hypothetical protein
MFSNPRIESPNDSDNPAETALETQPSSKNPTAVSAWVHRFVTILPRHEASFIQFAKLLQSSFD